MQSRDSQSSSFQPQSKPTRSRPLAAPSFEVSYPGQEIASSPTNPFARRPHETWAIETVAPPTPTLPTVMAAPASPGQVGQGQTGQSEAGQSETGQSQPDNKAATLDGNRVSLYSGGQAPPNLPTWSIQAKPKARRSSPAHERESDQGNAPTIAAPETTPSVQHQDEPVVAAKPSPLGWVPLSWDPPHRPSSARSQTVQTKVTIGQPNDQHEQEADRVAAQVMAMPDPTVQRQTDETIPNEESPEIQSKPLADAISPFVQRQGTVLPPVPNYQLTPPTLLSPPDPSARYRLGGEQHLHLDPELQAAALQYTQQQLTPAILRPTLTQLSLGAISLIPPQSGATTTSTTTTSTATSSTPLVPPGAGPDTPRPATPGDLLSAILAVPTIDTALTQLQTQAQERIRSDWQRLRLGEQIGVVSSLAVIGSGAIAGILATPDARQWVFNQLNGRVLPVPGVSWLRVEINTSADALMLGFHLDVGALLPPVLGFGSGSSTAIGGPPQPESAVPGVQRSASSPEVPTVQPDLESRLSSSQSGGTPLPDEVRSFMELRFGTDFSPVRVHTDGESVQMNQELGAQAFTHGAHIYYGAGKAPAKDELTGHELTHVVQQTGGQIQIQRNDDDQSGDTDVEEFAAVTVTSTNWHQLQQDGVRIASGLNGIRQIVVLTGSLRVFSMDGGILGTFPLRGNFRLSSGVYAVTGEGVARLGIRNGRFVLSSRLGVRTEDASEDLQQRVESRGTSEIQPEDWIDITPEVAQQVFQNPQLMLVSETISAQDESDESELEMTEVEPDTPETTGDEETHQQVGEGLREGGDPEGVSLPEFLRRPNQFPAFPATIQGPQVQPIGGTGDYSVQLTAPDAMTQLSLRLSAIGYRWELWNISNAPGVQDLEAQYGLLNLSSAPELQEHEIQVRQGEVPERGEDGQIIGRSEGVAQRFERATADLAERPDQIEADEAEAMSEGRYLDVLANEINSSLVGLEAVARYGSELLGAAADNFHDGSERQIPWEGQGVYVIRCTAVVNPEAEEGTATYAPSVATKVVVVAPLDQVARESLDAPLDEAAQLEVQLAGLRNLPEGDPNRARIPELEERLRTLDILATGDVIDVIHRNLQLKLNELLTLIDSSITLQHGLPDSRVRAVQRDFNAQVSQLHLAEERADIPHSPQLETLSDKIDELISTMRSSDDLLHGRSDSHVDSLRQEVNSLISGLGLGLSQGVERSTASSPTSTVQRVQATLVSRITGQTYPLLLQIREPSLEGSNWHCQLSDVTDQHGSLYSGDAPNSSGDVEAAKLRAVTEALEDFAGGAGYGEGSLAIRLPEAGWFASLSDEQRNQTLESRFRNWDAARRRLEELGTAIALLGLVVSSPIIGAVGAGLGAALAAQRFAQRVADGTFSWTDSQNVSDLIDILSAAAVGLGAGVRAIGPVTVMAEGEGFALQLTRGAQRLADAAETAETALDVVGVIHCNAEATAALISLSGQTGAEARRERASIIAGVIQSNGMFAHQMSEVQGSSGHASTSHSETSAHPDATDHSPYPESSRQREDTTTSRERAPEEADSDGGTEFLTPEHLRSAGEWHGDRHPESSDSLEAVSTPVESTDSSDGASVDQNSERTMAGTHRTSPEARHEEDASATTGMDRHDPRSPERLFELLGRGVDSQLSSPPHSDQAPHPSRSIYRQGIETPEEAYRIYNEALAVANGREVAIHYREQPHEYMVFMGDEGGVPVPAGWRCLIHYHPNPTHALTYRLPAPADFGDMIRQYMRQQQSVREFVEFDIPGVGRGRTEYGIEVGQERPFYVRIHYPDGSSETFRFAHDGDYRTYWSERTVYVDPDSPQHQHLIDDIERFIQESRRGIDSESESSERTMSGTSGRPRDQEDAVGSLDVSDPTDSHYHAREYFAGDATNPDGSPQARYYAEASLDENNILDMDFMLRRDDTPDAATSASGFTRSSQLRGREQFQAALDHFSQQGQAVHGIRGSWGGGDNLQLFNATYQAEIQNGATHEAAMAAASLATRTGIWALEAGFGQVQIESQDFDAASGSFTQVTVVFVEGQTSSEALGSGVTPEPGSSEHLTDSRVSIEHTSPEHFGGASEGARLPSPVIGERLSSAGDPGTLAARGRGLGVFAATMPDGTAVAVKIYSDTPRFRAMMDQEMAGAAAASSTSVGSRFYGEVDVGDGRIGFAMERVEGSFTEADHPDATSADREEAARAAQSISDQTFFDLESYNRELLETGYFADGEVQGLVDESGRWRPIDFQGVRPLSADPEERARQLEEHQHNISRERQVLETSRSSLP